MFHKLPNKSIIIHFKFVCFIFPRESGDGFLTHFWLILLMLFIPFINKLNMQAKIQNLYYNCK